MDTNTKQTSHMIPKAQTLRRINAANIIRDVRRNFTQPKWMERWAYVQALRAILTTLSL